MEASAPAHAGTSSPSRPSGSPARSGSAGGCCAASISFFFASFVFAYFYLRALDINHNWKIGPVHPAKGLGIAIMALFVVGAVIYRLAAKRPEVDELPAGIDRGRVVAGRGRAAVLRVHDARLRRAPAAATPRCSSAGPRLYAIVALLGALLDRDPGREPVAGAAGGRDRARPRCPRVRSALLRAGIEASSFYWAYFVAIGVARLHHPVPRRDA